MLEMWTKKKGKIQWILPDKQYPDKKKKKKKQRMKKIEIKKKHLHLITLTHCQTFTNCWYV